MTDSRVLPCNRQPAKEGRGLLWSWAALAELLLRLGVGVFSHTHDRERKALLASVVGRGDAVVKPVHFIEGAPATMVESVRELGLEGVVAKYSGAPYQGGRTSLWQKLVLRRPEKGWRVEESASRR